MNALQKIANVYAHDGVSGLVQRLRQRVPFLSEKADGRIAKQGRVMEAEKLAYEKLKTSFSERCAQLGYTGLDDYYWYHTVDLKDGLTTPGDYDFRKSIDSFGFPKDMNGMKVLDVGSATGFFAFEFERRGAKVTSVELPSFAEWDVLAVDREAIDLEMLKYFKASTPEEAYAKHLDAPFLFCQSTLKSQVKRVYSSIYDLNPTTVGEASFDLVYAGDILVHLFSPLKALNILSSLCKGSLYLTIEDSFPGQQELPLVLFQGGTEPGDGRSWWQHSLTSITHMLRRVGFANSSRVGAYSGIIRRQWTTFDRHVICANKMR